MKNTLIPIASHAISGSITETVHARQLHDFLSVGRDYSSWFKARTASYGFIEDEDYILISRSPKRGSGNRGASIEHHITLDMAKELAMVERNDKGREARRYFIECEKQLRTQSSAQEITPIENKASASDSIEERLIGIIETMATTKQEAPSAIQSPIDLSRFILAITESGLMLSLPWESIGTFAPSLKDTPQVKAWMQRH